MTKASATRRARQATKTPKANAYRGEALAEINGRQVKFCLTIGALADLSEAFGTRNNQALFARLSGEVTEIEPGKFVSSGPSMQDLPAIINALTGGEIDLDEARALGLSDMGPVMSAIARASSAAFPEEDPSKKGGVEGEANSATASPSTNGSASPGA